MSAKRAITKKMHACLTHSSNLRIYSLAKRTSLSGSARPYFGTRHAGVKWRAPVVAHRLIFTCTRTTSKQVVARTATPQTLELWRGTTTGNQFAALPAKPQTMQLRRCAASQGAQMELSELEGRNAALRVTWWGFGANVGLAGLKYVAGTLACSSALIADAAHSLSDLLTDFVTLFVLHYARVPADEDHPFGHGRFEALGSLAVSAVLIGTAGGIAWDALSTLQTVLAGSGAENAVLASGYGSVALGVCAISLVTKEMLYHASARVGRRINSQTLIANAWHHRSDALSSVACLVGVGGCMVGFPLLDPMAGLVVSGMVAKTGVEIAWEAALEVTERAEADDGLLVAVRAAAATTDGVLSIHGLRARKMGPYSMVYLHVDVDPDISVSAGYHVAERLRHKILTSESNVSEVLVHIQPFARAKYQAADVSMRSHTEVEREVRQVLGSVPEIRGVADVNVGYIPMSSSHVMLRGMSHGIHLKVDIICRQDITVGAANAIASDARGILLKLEGIAYVDVNLDLDE